MSTKTPARPRWSRTWPDRARPIRNAGGFYRTAEKPGSMYPGVPLNSANDAIVAAVRLAYKVAETQIDRSTRLAQRLRQAGDRAVGQGSDRKAVDAAERLVMKTLMSGLAWWEASVAEGRCPVRRLATAEYRMLGSMLGLTDPSTVKRKAPADAEEANQQPDTPAGREADRPSSGAFHKPLTILHKGPEEERLPVLVQNWVYEGTQQVSARVFLYNPEAPAEGPLEAQFVSGSRRSNARLTISTARDTARGLWRGAICDGEVQMGYIEILL